MRPAFQRAFAPHQGGAGAAVGLERQFEIVVDGVAFEHGRLLEFPADAEFGDLGLVEAGEIVGAVEHDVAEVRPGLAGDHVHHRGLAGAVRPDDGAHLAALDREREIVERLEAVERDGDAVQIKQRTGERFHGSYSAGSGSLTPSSAAAEARSRRSAFQCRMVPTMPRGNSSVTRTNSAPSMNSQ